MTAATQQALSGLRDLSMIKWYIIPLMAIVCYIYTREIKEARLTKNWNAVLAGLTIFGVDFFNETWNGWGYAGTDRRLLRGGDRVRSRATATASSGGGPPSRAALAGGSRGRPWPRPTGSVRSRRGWGRSPAGGACWSCSRRRRTDAPPVGPRCA